MGNRPDVKDYSVDDKVGHAAKQHVLIKYVYDLETYVTNLENYIRRKRREIWDREEEIACLQMILENLIYLINKREKEEGDLPYSFVNEILHDCIRKYLKEGMSAKLRENILDRISYARDPSSDEKYLFNDESETKRKIYEKRTSFIERGLRREIELVKKMLDNFIYQVKDSGFIDVYGHRLDMLKIYDYFKKYLKSGFDSNLKEKIERIDSERKDKLFDDEDDDE